MPLACLALMLAACSGPAPDTKTDGAMTSAGSVENTVIVPPDETVAEPENGTTATADPVGRWNGVEGMYLVVSKGTAPGRYRLEMQWDLDNKGVFDGTAKGDMIVFERKGVRQTLRPTDGAATGLKYLDGKAECLTVKPGEGYCRD